MKRNIDDIEEILSVCCGLVIIGLETSTVRLVLHTTQEYLKMTGSEQFADAKMEPARFMMHLEPAGLGVNSIQILNWKCH